MSTSLHPIYVVTRAVIAGALVVVASACSTPAPVVKRAALAAPRAPAPMPSVLLANMIKSMQVPAEQVSYFDQAGKPMTPAAFSTAINGSKLKYTVKASRNFSDGAWTAAAEVHLLDSPAVAQTTP